jgi:cbb3-type cytochrome oxidase maturation protein
MEILYLLVPLSVVLVFIIGLVFWWSLKSGQFEDLDGPGYRILADDDRPVVRDGASAEAPKRSAADGADPAEKSS